MGLTVYLNEVSPHIVYDRNITHNLTDMARVANIYLTLWRPEELGIKTAAELVSPLEEGLNKLRSDPEKFKKLNSVNGWGTYDDFVAFVEDYLNECKEHPNATVEVSR